MTPEQHLLLVVQSDPVVGEVRAAYEKQKAALAASQQQVKKATKTTATSTTKKKQQVATTTTRKKKASDGAQYKPRNEGSNSDAAAGGFAAGAILGTGLGLVLGNGH